MVGFGNALMEAKNVYILTLFHKVTSSNVKRKKQLKQMKTMRMS
jgi:hypothetical protein